MESFYESKRLQGFILRKGRSMEALGIFYRIVLEELLGVRFLQDTTKHNQLFFPHASFLHKSK